MRGSNLAWALLGGLVLAIALVGYFGIEWVEKQVDRGYSEEALRNDFLAAELFLRKQGIETETVSGMGLLDALPDESDLILLTASRESMSERRRTALAEWVDAGGKLFVVVHSLYDEEAETSEDRLLDELGIFLLAPDDEDAEEISEDDVGQADAEADAEAAEQDEEQSEQTDAEKVAAQAAERDEQEEAREAAQTADGAAVPEAAAAEDSTEPAPETLEDLMKAFLEPARCTQSEWMLTEFATAKAGNLRLELAGENELGVYTEQLDQAFFSSDAQVVFLTRGEGEIIGVTSIAPFRNSRIHCQDHAYFLYYAATGVHKVWLLHDPDVPSLAGLLWTEMPASTAGGLLLLLLVVAAASLRFGVAPLEREGVRRELREHLEASASFHFRKGGFAALYYRLRGDLERMGAAGSATDRSRWATRAGLSAEEAVEAFSDSVPWTRSEILKRMRIMLRMRRTR